MFLRSFSEEDGDKQILIGRMATVHSSPDGFLSGSEKFN
jgi:hypothetical protein